MEDLVQKNQIDLHCIKNKLHETNQRLLREVAVIEMLIVQINGVIINLNQLKPPQPGD